MGSKWYDCMAKSALLEPIPTLEGVKIGPYFVANCKVNHSALSAHSPKRHSFETSLHHGAKSSAIWDVHSYGASSQEGLPWTDFSLPHRKILRLINIVFVEIKPRWPWIAFCAGALRQLQLTRYWSTSVHVSCYLMTYDVMELKGFPNHIKLMGYK